MGMTTRIFLLALLAMTSMILPAWADSDFHASVGLSEEYTSNAEEEKNGREDFITSVKPSLGFTHEGGRTLFESTYSGSWDTYARGTRDQEFNHNLNAHGLLEAVEDFFFLDVTDTFSLINEDTTRGTPVEGDTSVDQVQRNVFTFSPYIEPHLTERTLLRTGYRYTNIWYDEGSNNDSRSSSGDSDYDNKNIHALFADLTHELTGQTSLLSGYSLTKEYADDNDLDRHVAYVGASYTYGENKRIFAKVGPQMTRYSDSGDSSTSLFWDAGWTHDLGPAILEVTSGVSFEDDPETGETYERQSATVRLTKLFERTRASVFATLERYEDQDGGSGSRSSANDATETTRRSYTGFSLSHEFSPLLTGTGSIAYDLSDSTDENVRRWFGSLVLTYLLAEDLSTDLWYRYKDVSGSEDDNDDFSAHRVGVLLRKSF